MSEKYESTMTEMQRVLKEKTKRYAFKKLEREIIQTGACVECGSCVAGCPVDAITGNRIKGKFIPELTGECISCGICYAMCPRTHVLEEDLIGDIRGAWKVRSLIDSNRQDGGAVTALLVYMMQTKYIEGAVVTCQSKEKPWLPEARLIENSEEISKCGGTIYTHAQVIKELLKGFSKDLSRLAFVGTACNVSAVKRMKTHPAGFLILNPDAHVFSISLFCMESFNYNDLKKFLLREGIKIEDVEKFAIVSGEFIITTDGKERRWPVAELNAAASTSCAYCQDFTGLDADISCGNIGSESGWTTVLVRTEEGEKILKGAIQSNMIEARTLEQKEIQAIINSSRFKKNKYYNLKNIHN